MHRVEEQDPVALLIGAQLPDQTDEQHEATMQELARLVDTLGFHVEGVYTQKRITYNPATIIGAGALEQIKHWIDDYQRGEEPDPSLLETSEEGEDDTSASATEPDTAEDAEESWDWQEDEVAQKADQGPQRDVVIVVNNELSPRQMRNLHQATDVEVLDRAGVIIEIFSRHARSREARLQVEIARLRYNAPRLRLTRGLFDRQGGGIGAKGAGESAHELNRRRIRDRIASLQHQLDAIAKEHHERRQRRSEARLVSLVGYTNAGKSSLMRALTGRSLYVADQLFATLDTTIRAMQPETDPRILITDTVGFIKQLPHDLVASFRTTLEEAHAASLLLHLVDGSDPNFEEQIAITRQVLQEIEADQERILVFNKRDLLSPDQQHELTLRYPDALLVSAHIPEDVQQLQQRIRTFFEGAILEVWLHIPYKQGHIVNLAHTQAEVLDEGHDDTGTMLHVRGTEQVIQRLRDQLQPLQ